MLAIVVLYFMQTLHIQYATYKEEFFPFVNTYADNNQTVVETPNATIVTNTRSQVLLTLGIRF